MKKMLISATAIMAGSLLSAWADPKDDVTSAAQKLSSGGNYTWQATTVVPADSRFKPGPVDGKIAGNLTSVKMSFGDNHTQFIKSGTNAAITDPDDGSWEKLSDVDTSGQAERAPGTIGLAGSPGAVGSTGSARGSGAAAPLAASWKPAAVNWSRT